MLDALHRRVCALPKAELHLHLEGSLTDHFWEAHDPSVLNAIETFRRVRAQSLPTFLSCMEQIHRSLHTPEHYADGLADLLTSLLADNVRYAEITWAPGAIWEFHAVPPQLVYDRIAPLLRTWRPQLDARILIDLIRNQPVQLSERVVAWLERARPPEVVGINVGGDEERFPIHPLVPLIRRVRAIGLRVTIHAGESVDESTMLDAIRVCRPDRIGHATALRSPHAIKLLRGAETHVEACPTSNYRLGYLPRPGHHPLLTTVGLRGSINTDDRSFFNGTLSQEIAELITTEVITFRQAAQFQLAAVADAFAVTSPVLQAITDAWSKYAAAGAH